MSTPAPDWDAAGAETADWLNDLVRAGAVERATVERRLRDFRHTQDLIRLYALGPRSRVIAARLRATGVRAPGARMTAPPGAFALLDAIPPPGAPQRDDPDTGALIRGLYRRWYTAYRSRD